MTGRARQPAQDVLSGAHSRARLLARLLRRRTASGSLHGAYASRFRGRGLEPAEVRAYAEGDDFRAIDWKVTSRLGSLHVRQFEDERDRPLWILQDVSASTAAGGGQARIWEAIAEAGLLIAGCAFASRDPVGLVRFSDRLETVLPPSRHVAHLHAVSGALAMPPARRAPRDGSGGADLGAALEATRRFGRRKGTVLVLTDAGLRWSGSRNTMPGVSVCALVVRDPWLSAWPEGGFWEMEDPESGSVRRGWMSRAAVRRMHEQDERRMDSLLGGLARNGVSAAAVFAGADPLPSLARVLSGP